MLGLTVHNFLSAATGLAMAFALVRAFARSSATTVGNFWVDVTRVTLYILLPISVVGALVFVALGMPQTLAGAVDATTLEGAKQTISIGPVASQEIIKELGTNGGGFFNANAAHPFENPNAWTNILEIWALLLIPVASVLAFGRAVGDMRQGWAIVAAMAVFFIVGVGIAYWSETAGNPILTAQGVDPSAGNLEGKEIRNGQAMSVLYATATSGTSTGSVNTMHDSLTPLAGMVPMFNLLAGCIWPGGVGAGLYGFLVLAIIAVFVAGLMVGRTPEYLGKKIEVREMKFAMLAVLIYPLIVLGFTGASVLLQTALDSLGQQRPARPLRNHLSLRLEQRQQRLGFRRDQRQHALVQHDGRPRHAARPLRLCRAGAGDGRLARGEEEGPGLGGDVPDRRAAVRRPVGRRHRHSLPSAIFPGPVARAGRRALPDARRQDLLIGDRPMSSKAKPQGLFDSKIIAAASIDALRKLDPRALAKNPVIFVTEVVSLMVTLFFIRDLVTHNGTASFSGQIAAWLWFTVLFANFAEAVAEGRGKAQADALRRTRTDTRAKRYIDPENLGGVVEGVNALDLRLGDIVLVEAGEIIPGDGDIVEGVASVNEFGDHRRIRAGHSRGWRRPLGGHRRNDRAVRLHQGEDHAAPGSTFIDRMIALVEGAERQKTPNELALSILLSGLTIIFLIVCVTLWPIAKYSGTDLSATVLIALLVCLIPTTIGGLLSAIGIAGMDRLVRFNVIATSGRAVEAAGDVDTLLLDKTGTITFGNRMATEFLPVNGVKSQDLASAALASSLADETPEGRSIVALAKGDFGLVEPQFDPRTTTVVPFTAQTRISGVDVSGRSIRKGAIDSILRYLKLPIERTPLGVSSGGRAGRDVGRHAAGGCRRRPACWASSI